MLNSNEQVSYLGLHQGHNSSVAMVEDGFVTFAMQEERVSRVKNQGGFPRGALDRCNQQTGKINLAFAGGRIINAPWRREEVIAGYGNPRPQMGSSLKRFARTFAPISKAIDQRRVEQLCGDVGKSMPDSDIDFHFVDHHQCHAASAYFAKGDMDSKVLVLTCDGAGDELCASVSIGHKGQLQRISGISKDSSIGRLYANITFLMGMVPLEHEYKLMGLAPYAEHSSDAIAIRDMFRSLFRFTEDGMGWSLSKGVPAMQFASEFLASRLMRKRFDHVAAGLQLFTQEFLVEWVENCIGQTGIPNLALGGGVFMNVKANQRILESPKVESCFFMPSCGDETNVFGAAWSQYVEKTGMEPEPLTHLYLGDEFQDEEIEESIAAYKFSDRPRVEQADEIEQKVASLLASGEVVARFAGRMEFGARSLGNRAILANPSSSTAVKTINKMIKNRDFWMPFTPSVLPHRVDDYFVRPKGISVPYMIVTLDSKKEVQDTIPAVLHPFDGTGRPQEVFEDWNPSYYEVIETFESLSGIGLILNTSFNLHGEPVVRTPSDALRVFELSGLQHLALGSFLLSKT
ncbi:MAG: hypothetical protein JJ956_15320 [Pseudomonadales bacterium]|nr:hypothetical protein [Pseudomonadales bacterium]